MNKDTEVTSVNGADPIGSEEDQKDASELGKALDDLAENNEIDKFKKEKDYGESN